MPTSRLNRKNQLCCFFFCIDFVVIKSSLLSYGFVVICVQWRYVRFFLWIWRFYDWNWYWTWNKEKKKISIPLILCVLQHSIEWPTFCVNCAHLRSSHTRFNVYQCASTVHTLAPSRLKLASIWLVFLHLSLAHSHGCSCENAFVHK